MAGGKACHREITDFQRLAVHGNGVHCRRDRTAGGKRVQRVGAAVQRNGVLFQKGIEAGDMVRMLMGDQDAHTVTDRQTERFQGCKGRAAAFAHINKQILLPAADKPAVSGGA